MALVRQPSKLLSDEQLQARRTAIIAAAQFLRSAWTENKVELEEGYKVATKLEREFNTWLPGILVRRVAPENKKEKRRGR